jgi:hypothetical protein
MASDDGRKATLAAHQTMLCNQARTWPIPRVSQAKGRGNPGRAADGTNCRLEDTTAAWCPPSPQELLIYDGWTSLEPIPFADLPSAGSISGPLLAEISVYRRWSQRSGGAAGWRGIWTRRPRRSLGTRFAEYLMGWPIGWTDCASAATGFTRWQQDMRGLLSTLCSRRPRQERLL